MARQRTRTEPGRVERLGVFMNGIEVGTLKREPSGALSFSYDQSWLERENPFPISRHFILRDEPYVGRAVRDYFDNLLPDDARIRERIAAVTNAEGTQSFDLLAAVGRDCVGALQFYPQGQVPGPVKPVEGESLSESGIAELIRSLRVNPLGISTEQDFRISLAGAQTKTALLQQEGQWLRPKGPTPTTHIFKPNIGQIPEGPDMSLSVENEWLCLRIVKSFDVPAAVAEIKEFDGMKVLVVERFDRRWSGEKLFRLPQEDMCQALGFGPERKYEAEGGPGIREILSLLNESDQRDEDRRLFMKSQLVFWLIAAIDGHAKNFSAFIRPSGFVLTPLYDVMSADPHINPKTLPRQKINLAMAVGSSRHYKIQEIFPRHWVQTAKDTKFAGMEGLMAEVVVAAPKVIENVASKLPKGFPKEVSERIFEGMTARAKKLSSGD
jgi:serine/threonine-protein kinase HipA